VDFLAVLAPGEQPYFSLYQEWAASQPRDADGRTHVPSRKRIFQKLFGSWRDALIAAGAKPGAMVARKRPRALRFTKDEAVASLRVAYRELGDPFSALRYDYWVHTRDRRQSSASARSGSPSPSSVTVSQIFGGWRPAVEQVLGAHALRPRKVRRPEFTTDDLVEAWRHCANEVGHPPSLNEYFKWRIAVMESEPSRAIPAPMTLMRRLGRGCWSGLAAMIGDPPARPQRRIRPYTMDEITGAVHAYLANEDSRPSKRGYELWRGSKMRNEPTIYVPTIVTLEFRLGRTWSQILAETTPPTGGP
jgi:hypothetical protein